MAEYIDRNHFDTTLMMLGYSEKDLPRRALAQQPTADVAPVVQGRWLDDGTGNHLCQNCGCYADYDEYEMDVRGEKREHLSPFCPTAVR